MNARNERNQHKKETEDKQMAAILSINAAGQSGKKINKNIYGHFSEHLGRCIYGGIYVGENSDIPNASITLEVPDEVLAQRKAKYVAPEPNIKTGWLSRYARMVTSANLGAVLK